MSVAEGTEEDKGPSAKEGEAVPVVKMSGRVTNTRILFLKAALLGDT